MSKEKLKAIAEMAVQFQIPIFPCGKTKIDTKGKTPKITNWEQNASCDRAQIDKWLKWEALVHWGMPTGLYFALDYDTKGGGDYGDVKPEWTKGNPYRQTTQSGGLHILYKNPGDIRNANRFTGSWDRRGAGGYICLYEPIFNEFKTPDNVPEAPAELLALCHDSGKVWDRGVMRDATPEDTKTWPEGQRNASFSKSLWGRLNQGKPYYDLIEKAKRSGLALDEILAVISQAQKKLDEEQTKQKINILEIIKYMAEEAIKHIEDTNPQKILKAEFWSNPNIYPKNNFLLLTGTTEGGKTASTLRFLEHRLKEGIQCAIWAHSESNTINRYNEWQGKLSEEQKKILFISRDKQKLLEFLGPNKILFIDDTDSFLRIENPLSRREVGDAIDALSYYCQYAGATIIGAHYQTKTSKKEEDIKNRSGGAAVWMNKARYAGLIETGTVQKLTGKETLPDGTIQDFLGQPTPGAIPLEETHKEETRSFIAMQKGHKASKKTGYWFKKDWDIDTQNTISATELRDIIQANSQKDSKYAGEIARLIHNYMREDSTDKMKMDIFYKMCQRNLGIEPYKALYHLRKVRGFFVIETGFGQAKETFISKHPRK